MVVECVGSPLQDLRFNCMLGGYILMYRPRYTNVLSELETSVVYDDLVIIPVDRLIEGFQ